MDIDECELTSLMFHFNTFNMFVLGLKMSFSNLKCCLKFMNIDEFELISLMLFWSSQKLMNLKQYHNGSF
jgi:hypothetical protein